MLVYNKIFIQWNTQIKQIFRKTSVFNHERIWLNILRCYAKDVSYETPVENIRNFSIIAHVDHGKSTLADRFLEMTGAIKRNSGQQILDKLQVEKERGITVKAQTASLNYRYEGKDYLLNLIDTPGHVDFNTEVQRSLVPCQGVILLVDANDGVQAQTVANYYLARERNLVIIPVINKIDLKNANPDKVVGQLESLFQIKKSDVLKISAKVGTGVDEIFKEIVKRIPPPLSVDRNKPFRALRFDSWFDKYKGAISLIYVTEGSISVGNQISCLSLKKNYEVRGLYLLRPDEESVGTLYAGQVGCLHCSMRTSKEAVIGDTLCLKNSPVEPHDAIKPQKPVVFAGVYPFNQLEFNSLKSAIEKLALNDSGVSLILDSSVALGRGWRVGFLGMLHMEVFIQRLEQEYEAEAIVTSPSVTYKAKIFGSKNIVKYKGEMISFNSPIDFPDPVIVTEFYEPIVLGTIITPDEYLTEVQKLCRDKRGEEHSVKSIGNSRSMIQYYLPLNEIIVDFYDTLKYFTSGYASFDYEDHDYVVTDIVKLNILLNNTSIEELSVIVHKSRVEYVGRQLCLKLKDIIPRQLYEVAIQATVGSKIIARETVKAYKKDVTAKLYGGDITRRRKLLAQQAEGKKQMKMRTIGNIKLPKETFIEVLKK